jgi:hypothetical protein
MAVEYDKSGKLFQVDYQAPFGGIDTTAFASAIEPKNFAALATALVNANQLSPVGWSELIIQSIADTDSFLGYIPVVESSTIGYIITMTSVIVVASDGAGGLTFTTVTSYAPAVTTYGYFSYVVIDNLLIWTTQTWNEIWSYDITTGVIARLTNYVGGGFLGVVNNQLINLGGVSALDGEVPYRISWSAPGQYGQFLPYDVSSGLGNYAAGFNDLPSTSDVLVGIITVGTVAYLFRSQGITQMSPTGNGIQPFSFNHLWASQLGIGTVLPDTISQYAGAGAFIADSGIYSLGISGLTDITGQARELIFNVINNIPNFASRTALPLGIVTGVCVPYLLSHSSVYYVIGILNSMTQAIEGVSPSASTYALYAIDLNNNYACYDLGTQKVAADPTVTSDNAVGKLSFVNRAYSSAPSPIPPSPPSYTPWANVTFYTPFNAWDILDPSNVGWLYELTTSGIVPATINLITTATPPAAIGDMIIVGTAVFTYKGPRNWTAAQTNILGQFTTFVTGSAPYFIGNTYKCIQAGISGGSQAGWSTTPGNVIIDGTALYQCIGPSSKLFPANFTPSGATSYKIASNSVIVDPGTFLQQNTNTTVEDYTFHLIINHFWTSPGGFSQTSAPTWNDTTAGATNETPVLSTTIPPATWICLGLIPSPPTTLVGANIAQIVPLFIAINNKVGMTGFSTFTAIKLIPPTLDNLGTFVFRKEQLRFGYQPTVTKIGIIATLINAAQNGTIKFSIDGGLTFGVFPDLILLGGTGQLLQNFYQDAVQTLERPQLVLQLTNVIVVEAWYQGTLADFPLI